MVSSKPFRKRGQLHITETIAVLFIFFILIVFAIIFYYQYQKVSLKEKQQELLGQRAVKTTLKTIFLPELICSRGDAEPEDNCFEVSKLEKAGGLMQQHTVDYYFNIFSYANITVHQIYPENEAKIFKIYTKEITKTISDGKVVPGWSNRETSLFVVTLKEDRFEGEPSYGFGYLKVEVYS